MRQLEVTCEGEKEATRKIEWVSTSYKECFQKYLGRELDYLQLSRLSDYVCILKVINSLEVKGTLGDSGFNYYINNDLFIS